MARPRSPLDPHYGALKVVADYGGDTALVECTCGRQKWVLRSNLRAGRIKSCGSAGCRPYATRVGKPRHVDMPDWLPQGAVANVYNMAKALGVIVAAEQIQQDEATVTQLVDTIDRFGSVDAYLQHINEAAEAKADTTPEPGALGSTPVKPPSAWVAKP